MKFLKAPIVFRDRGELFGTTARLSNGMVDGMKMLIAFTVSSLLAASPALAGPLGDINREIGNKQERRSAEPAPQPRRDSRDSDHRDHDDNLPSAASAVGVGGTALIVSDGTASPGSVPAGPFSVELVATYTNIKLSDGALNADIMLKHGNAGLAFSSSSYFESEPADKSAPEEQARLTRWELAAMGRALAIGGTELWLAAGIGQLHGSGFEALTGLSLSGHVRHHLAGQSVGGLALEASARGIMYTDDIDAAEFRAGVTASVVRVGYRVLDFNVGPPLKGPEIGVSLRF